MSCTIKVRERTYKWDYNENDDILISETFEYYTCKIPIGETISNLANYDKEGNSWDITYDCMIMEYTFGNWVNDNRFVIGSGLGR